MNPGPWYRDCALKIRVFKKIIHETNLKPIILIHGGSWQYRGASVVGIESYISHFTDLGYVVFTPFYRLAENNDGPDECNKRVAYDVLQDAEDILEWVKKKWFKIWSDSI